MFHSNILTISSCGSYQTCRQKYYWRYESGLDRIDIDDGEALSIGKAVHVGMDADNMATGMVRVCQYFNTNGNALGEDQQRKQDGLRAKCCAMVQSAWERWPERLGKSEVKFEVAICNPQTGGKSKTFRFAGKIDYLTEKEIYDWKTATNSIQFITQKKLGYQLPGYVLGIQKTISKLVYRIIEKPTIRLKQSESPEEYQTRCIEWLNQPGKLIEEPIWFTEASLAAFKEYLWDITQSLLFARRKGIWLRNENACYNYNRECKYMPLCLQLAAGTPLDNIKTDGYEVTGPHPELE